MKQSLLMDYLEEKDIEVESIELLPLFHSCEGYSGTKIIEEGILKVQECKVFSKELSYYFYGKPAYPVGEKFPEKRTDEFYCPVCFIVKPETVPIYEIYPFDTGAFEANIYSDFFPRGIKLEDYRLKSELEIICSYIKVMFGNNDNYLSGKCIQSDYDLPEIRCLINMLNPKGAFDIDERSNTVEVISDGNVYLKDVIECIILPDEMLRNRHVKEFLAKHSIKYKTYRFKPLSKAERYYELICHLAMEHIEERRK